MSENPYFSWVFHSVVLIPVTLLNARQKEFSEVYPVRCVISRMVMDVVLSSCFACSIRSCST